ncbi:MAG: hypothetical protein ACKOC0_04885, partial [Cytophagales bacterium]
QLNLNFENFFSAINSLNDFLISLTKSDQQQLSENRLLLTFRYKQYIFTFAIEHNLRSPCQI